MATPSGSSYRREPAAGTRKGKEKDNSSYRFPDKGRNGGSPDPFEVLGLDRSASEAEVKRQCELS